MRGFLSVGCEQFFACLNTSAGDEEDVVAELLELAVVAVRKDVFASGVGELRRRTLGAAGVDHDVLTRWRERAALEHQLIGVGIVVGFCLGQLDAREGIQRHARPDSPDGEKAMTCCRDGAGTHTCEIVAKIDRARGGGA